MKPAYDVPIKRELVVGNSFSLLKYFELFKDKGGPCIQEDLGRCVLHFK